MPVSQKTARPAIRVELVEDDGDWSELAAAEADIENAAGAVARAIDVPAGVISVVLSSDVHVSSLNERFRGKPVPTNVLSFPAGSGAESGHLGDIVLARETVWREAQEQGVAVVHHVQHLVVHGILHLLGYDHMTAADAERMETQEIKILSELGIANPYTGELETGTRE